MSLLAFVALTLPGLAIAAAFDWISVVATGKILLATAKERRQAFLTYFAWHGPWFGLAFPLLVGGALAPLMRRLGLAEPLGGLATMVAFAAIGGVVIWLTHQLPAVKDARAAVSDKLNAAQAENNRRWGRFLMASPRPASPPADREKSTDA